MSTMARHRNFASSWFLIGATLSACNATVDPIGGGPSSASTGFDSSAVATAASTGGTAGGGGIGTGGSGGSGMGGAPDGGGTSISIALYDSELFGGGSSVTVATGTGVGGAGGFESGVTTGSGSSGGSSGGSAEGERLFLIIDDGQLSCAAPFDAVPDDCSTAPRALIGLPPAYQERPGTYALSDSLIVTQYFCGDEGAPFLEGTIQISSFGSEQIVATLADTSPPGLDGSHTILRCTPFIPLSNRAISYFANNPPDGGAGGGTSVGTTSGGGDDSFVFNLSSHAQSCAEPSGDPPGPGEIVYDFYIHIPPAYLTPGTYSLSDPLIGVTRYEMSSNTGSVASGGSDTPGTLTILEITDVYVDARIEGTGFDYADGEGQIPRCGF